MNIHPQSNVLPTLVAFLSETMSRLDGNEPTPALLDHVRKICDLVMQSQFTEARSEMVILLFLLDIREHQVSSETIQEARDRIVRVQNRVDSFIHDAWSADAISVDWIRLDKGIIRTKSPKKPRILNSPAQQNAS